MRGAEEEGHVDEGQEGGETEKSDAATEGGNGEEEEAESVEQETSPQRRFQTYKEAVEKYSLQYSDFDMVGSYSFILIVIFSSKILIVLDFFFS